MDKNCMSTATRVINGIFGTCLLFAASQAQAVLITSTGSSAGSPTQPTYQAAISTADVGQTFSLDWLIAAGTGSLPVDLTATVTFTINSFSLNASGNDILSLGITIANTTDLSAYPGTNSAILAFGFGVTPDATASLVSSGTTFDSVGSGSGPQQTFPGGFKQIDVCIFSAGCSGGDVNSGLQAGNSDSLVLNLSGNFDQNGTGPGALSLLDFPLKFQGTWGSFETPGQTTRVPEPTTLSLLGIALLGLGLSVRLRKSR
jgi:hypothetical protein